MTGIPSGAPGALPLYDLYHVLSCWKIKSFKFMWDLKNENWNSKIKVEITIYNIWYWLPIESYIYIYMKNIVSLFNLLIITQTWAGTAGDRHKRQETYLSTSWLFMSRRRALTCSSMNTPVSTLEELTRISYVFLFWYRLQQLFIVHSIKSRVLNSAWIMNGRNFISSKFSVPRFFSVSLSGE